MKKLFLLFINLVILFSFTMCTTPAAPVPEKKEPGQITKNNEKTLDMDFLKNLFSSKKEEPAKGPDYFLTIDTDYSQAEILDSCVTQDQQFLVTCSVDKTIKVWNLETGKTERKILPEQGNGLKGLITCLALSPDDRYLACAGFFSDKALPGIEIFDFQSGTPVKMQTISGYTDSQSDKIIGLIFSDNYLVALSASCVLQVWTLKADFEKKLVMKTGTSQAVACEAFTAGEDTRVVAAHSDGSLVLVSLKEKKVLKEYRYGSAIKAVAKNNQYLAACGNKKEIILLNRELEVLAAVKTDYTPLGLACSPDNNYLAVNTGDKPGCTVYSLSPGLKKQQIFRTLDTGIAGMHYTGSGSLLCIAKEKPVILLWDPVKDKTVNKITGNSYQVLETAITGNELYIRDNQQGPGKIFNITALNLAAATKPLNANRLTPAAGECTLTAQLPDAKPDNSGGLILDDGKNQAALPYSGDNYKYGFVNENLILVENNNQTVVAYDKTGKKLSVLTGYRGVVKDLVFSDKFLVILDEKNICNLYYYNDLDTAGQEITPVLGLYAGSSNNWVCFSRNGHYTAGNGGEKDLWLYTNLYIKNQAEASPVYPLAKWLENKPFIKELLDFSNHKAADARITTQQMTGGLDFLDTKNFFVFKSLGRSWVRADYLFQNTPLIKTAFMNPLSGITFMIMATEAENPFISQDINALVDNMIDGYKTTLKSFTLQEKKEYTLGGKQGIFFMLKGELLNNPCKYIGWCYSANSRFYFLVGYYTYSGSEKNLQTEEMLKAYSHFDYYTPGSCQEGTLPQTGYSAQSYGYSVKFGNTGWKTWENITKYYPAAQTGGYYGSDLAFLMISLYTGSLDPSPEALTYSFLNNLEIDIAGKTPANYRKTKDDKFKGVEFDHSDANYNYHFRILDGTHYAYCIVLLSKKGKQPAADMAETLYKCITIDETQAQIPDMDKAPAAERESSAALINQLGKYYFDNNQYSRAARFFREALEHNKSYAIYLENYLRAAAFSKEYADALAYLEQQLENFADNFNIASYQPFFQDKLGQKEKALQNYKKLFNQDYRDDYDLEIYLNLLWDTGATTEVYEAIKAYQKKGYSQYIARTEAKFLAREEKYTEAEKILYTLYESTAYDLDLTADLLELLNSMGKYNNALEICNDIISENHESAAIFFNKGINELDLKWYKEAKNSFEKALALSPQDTTIKEYVDYVSGLLGEGENSNIKKEISPVPADPGYFQLINSSLPDKYKDRDAFYLHRITIISYQKAKDYKRTVYFKIKVLNEAGIMDFNTFELPFDQADESIFVNKVNVYDAADNLKTTGNPSSYYVLNAAYPDTTSSKKILNIPIPGLQAGDTIEIVATWEEYAGTHGFSFYRDSPVRLYPVINNYFIITGDTAELAYSTHNMEPPVAAGKNLVWQYRGDAAIMTEPYYEDVDNYLPVFGISSKTRTWEKEAGEYLSEIKPKLQITNDVLNLAQELTKETRDAEEKIELLCRYVQKNYVYNALFFGRRAWLPNDGTTIIHNKYGDCKDHAVLLYLLLTAVQIPCHLTLVNNQNSIFPDLQDIDQFNHMILYIPGYRNGVFIDPTDKYYDIYNLVPPGLAEKNCLVLDEKNPRIITVPTYSGDSYLVQSERTVVIDNTGSFAITEKLGFNGYSAGFMREYLKQFEANQYQTQIQNYMAGPDSSLQLDQISIENLDEISLPLVLNLDYKMSKHLKKLENKMVGSPPFIWEQLFINIQHIQERTTPFRIYYPSNFISTIRIKTGQDMQIKETKDNKKENRDKYAQWSLARSHNNNMLTIDFSFSLKTGAYAKEEYAIFEKSVNSALDALGEEIVLSR